MQKYIYAGRIAKDAELAQIGGKNYAKLNLAVDDGKDKYGNKKTLWVSVLKLDPNGNLYKYLTSGTSIGVEGKLTASGYQKDDEIKVNLTLWANSINFLGSTQRSTSRETTDNAPNEHFGNGGSDLPF